MAEPSPAAVAKAAERMHTITLASVYPLYLKKVESKGRTEAELRQVITWLTGYDNAGIDTVIKNQLTFAELFAKAPKLNPKAELVTGVICGYRVETIADPILQNSRRLDKLIDELAKGRPMEKILRK